MSMDKANSGFQACGLVAYCAADQLDRIVAEINGKDGMWVTSSLQFGLMYVEGPRASLDVVGSVSGIDSVSRARRPFSIEEN